jgi:hypothetical protein
MPPLRRLFSGALVLGALLSVLPAPSHAGPPGKGRQKSARGAEAARRTKAKKPRRGCKREKAKSFLIRKNYLKNGGLPKALRFRAERYGWVEGAGLEDFAEHSALSQAVDTRFMGLPIRVHKKVAPKLRCVERTIKKSCNGKGKRYVPKAIGGFRESNTYRKGEVSNHMFGIAIDIDPDRNPCCGCVDPWPNHRYCQAGKKSVYEKTELTRCWIEAFENHGFYWLGHDSLEDTMHFEYLGDPDR